MTADLVANALAALRQRDFPRAREFISLYGQENAFELQHYLIKGLAELALENWQAAFDTFSEASELFPHQPQIWLNLGIAQ
jgi:hypothetical protein